MSRDNPGLKPPIPASPYRAHRRRGEGFGSCLLMIVLVLGGAIFAWYKFGKNRALIRAGEQILVMGEYNLGSDQEYRRHFRERNSSNSLRSRDEVNKFYTDTIKGKYKGKSSDFDQRYHEANQFLLDSITELDMNVVPKQFLTAHKKLSGSYKPLYECLEATKEGYYAEGPEQKAAYDRAKAKLAEGWKMSVDGQQAILGQIQRWDKQ